MKSEFFDGLKEGFLLMPRIFQSFICYKKDLGGMVGIFLFVVLLSILLVFVALVI